jgi:hypothetical protein
MANAYAQFTIASGQIAPHIEIEYSGFPTMRFLLLALLLVFDDFRFRTEQSCREA